MRLFLVFGLFCFSLSIHAAKRKCDEVNSASEPDVLGKIVKDAQKTELKFGTLPPPDHLYLHNTGTYAFESATQGAIGIRFSFGPRGMEGVSQIHVGGKIRNDLLRDINRVVEVEPGKFLVMIGSGMVWSFTVMRKPKGDAYEWVVLDGEKEAPLHYANRGAFIW